ncbi:hypothetical protein ACLOJK_011143 [Asimina triloba]
MNHHVPDSDMEEDSGMPSSSSARYLDHKKSSRTEDDDVVELVWQNGQIVLQSQTSHKESVKLPPDAILPGRLEPRAGDEIGSSTTTATAQQLFLQEDEMASWLHYPIVDEPFVDHRDVFGGDLLYPAAPVPLLADGRSEEKPAQPPDPQPMAPPARAGSSSRPPLHPSRRTEGEKKVNFTHFSRGKGKAEYRPLDLERPGRESTVVESNETPAGVRVLKGERFIGGNAGSITCGGGDWEVGTCEQTMTSSSGGSGASAERQAKRSPPENRKRKARQGEESECQNEVSHFTWPLLASFLLSPSLSHPYCTTNQSCADVMCFG